MYSQVNEQASFGRFGDYLSIRFDVFRLYAESCFQRIDKNIVSDDDKEIRKYAVGWKN